MTRVTIPIWAIPLAMQCAFMSAWLPCNSHLSQRTKSWCSILLYISVLMMTLGAATLGHGQTAAQNGHPFWDANNIAGTVAMTGFAAADVAQTCNYRATYRNFHEQPFPVGSPLHSCAGVTAYVSATKLGSFAGMRAAHAAGHHRAERWIPWLNAAGSAGAVFAGLIDSRRGIKFAARGK
jgi:hypothetical protein